MSISRRVLQAAAVSGLVVGLTVPAAAAFADSAPAQPDQRTSASVSQDSTQPGRHTTDSSKDPSASAADPSKSPADSAPKEQHYRLSNGAQAHVYTLPDGSYMAWITVKGQRVANLDAHHASSTVHKYRYVLNQANGFVGVVHPDGWHSEQDVPDPHGDSHQQKHQGVHQKSHQKTDRKTHEKIRQDTRDQRAVRHSDLSAAQSGGAPVRAQGELPRGGVKAGAEGVSSHSSETPLLVAAGGGLALAGAGLGYLGLRRGRRHES
ncbi:hypothetical protein [Streptomyces sp. NPDC088785]|uniref:hypothetical protein n=1 Tax=Streptomyces sp. NPDC088785 TaxID=3365897 RepID=UPI00381C3283